MANTENLSGTRKSARRPRNANPVPPPPPPKHPTTADYLRYLGMAFKACRGDRSIAEVARGARLNRSTIERLERGASDVTVRSQIDLAAFYDLTLTDLHQKTLELLGLCKGAAASSGSVIFNMTDDDRETVLSALAKRNRPHP